MVTPGAELLYIAALNVVILLSGSLFITSDQLIKYQSH